MRQRIDESVKNTHGLRNSAKPDADLRRFCRFAYIYLRKSASNSWLFRHSTQVLYGWIAQIVNGAVSEIVTVLEHKCKKYGAHHRKHRDRRTRVGLRLRSCFWTGRAEREQGGDGGSAPVRRSSFAIAAGGRAATLAASSRGAHHPGWRAHH